MTSATALGGGNGTGTPQNHNEKIGGYRDKTLRRKKEIKIRRQGGGSGRKRIPASVKRKHWDQGRVCVGKSRQVSQGNKKTVTPREKKKVGIHSGTASSEEGPPFTREK